MALESENSVMTGSINEDKQMVAVQRSIRQLEQRDISLGTRWYCYSSS